MFDPAASEPLTPGLVITVEPIIAAGRGDVVAMPDGWTVRTADGSPVAHAEHTIVVTDGGADRADYPNRVILLAAATTAQIVCG